LGWEVEVDEDEKDELEDTDNEVMEAVKEGGSPSSGSKEDALWSHQILDDTLKVSWYLLKTVLAVSRFPGKICSFQSFCARGQNPQPGTARTLFR
tara:strand:- start:131 stop:415 length:285 start_codon:yes stop_codon:yes gene_type:complete